MKVLHTTPIGLKIKHQNIGGTEEFIYQLDKQLINQQIDSYLVSNNESILFDGDSRIYKDNSMIFSHEENQKQHDKTIFSTAIQAANELNTISINKPDIIHNHSGIINFFSKNIVQPIVTTLHFIPEWYLHPSLSDNINNRNFYVAVSKTQKKAYEMLGYHIFETIYNGIDISQYPLLKTDYSGKYLIQIARISTSKGQDIAIKIARKAKLPLIIAGGVSDQNEDYFNQQIAPHLDLNLSNADNKKKRLSQIELTDQIVYWGSATHEDKAFLYSKAMYYISPLRLEEPFGISTIESLASGVPIITFGRGFMKELIDNERIGIIADSEDDMLNKIIQLPKFEPTFIHNHIQKHYNIENSTQKYINLYHRIIETTQHDRNN